MEESNEDANVVPAFPISELYFLIAKFLCGGPLKETAKTLLKELDSVEVLPRRLDWEGNEHAQSYQELASQHTDVSWRRLASVCQRALQLARAAPSPLDGLPTSSLTDDQTLKLRARLSLLSETLVRPKPKYASYKQDHTLVRRLVARELGTGAAALAGGRGGPAAFPPRMLSGLQLQRRTLGHLSAVYCLVFDCTGRYVVTGADDLLVKVWSAIDGRLLTTLRGAGAEITDVCISSEGALLACGSVERLVRVWCLATGAPKADVRWLASTSTDGSVAFWTCSPEGAFLSQPVQYVERMRPGACHMICAAWSPGGAFLAAGSADHHVRLYAVEHEPGGPRRALVATEVTVRVRGLLQRGAERAGAGVVPARDAAAAADDQHGGRGRAGRPAAPRRPPPRAHAAPPAPYHPQMGDHCLYFRVTSTARHWGQGDRFRCMIDDSWWTGIVLERLSGAPGAGGGGGGGAAAPWGAGGAPGGDAEARRWAAAAASHFLSLRVRWDNGEIERLSPWDLEPLDPERLPAEPGGSVPVLPHELEAVLYRAEASEWPPRGDRAAACRAIAQHISQVMSLSVAEPFVAPVDLQAYPSYAKIVPYPIDLATIRARFDNLFYRRAAAAQFDVRYLASNAEQFNEGHSPIVRQARLVTDLLLHIISHWREVDVVAKYHELAASYHSSDDEPLAAATTKWVEGCAGVWRELMASADAGPFRQPVSADQAPDYRSVITNPMDLGTVGARLSTGEYSSKEQFAADVRLVFANSRLYNTNKRSRIYSMTVRLSALFEALWSRMASSARGAREARRPRRVRRPTRHTRRPTRTNNIGDSGSEPLAATSRRVHARADSWDSDAPLRPHTKGKGVGKKSKSSSASFEPLPSTSRDSLYSEVEVLEEELDLDDGDLTYAEDAHRDPDEGSSRRHHRDQVSVRLGRKRGRPWSSGSSAGAEGRTRTRPRGKRKKDRHPVKRVRERFGGVTSSCSSSSGGEGGAGRAGAEGARRYESDHSYRPRYSTDDDAPLNTYRQRHEPEEGGAGPSGGGGGGAGVSLRTRRSPRRYNEDSEEDSIAAISKRLQHHHDHHDRHRRVATRRRHHATQSAHAEAGAALGVGLSVGVGVGVGVAPNDDHDYFNGQTHAHHNHNGVRTYGESSSNSNSTPGPGPVSISSRGRVRKLTAKARGLLHD
ncbi:hypothetical protein K1T71_014700 [Dendrolimus kikuchii]|uniref:Uncharacterized protein n=1 Tax=Dendrolimus kikuchii TaxID=765133 RepID=A0ACC1CF53_9NEOP|nr:hypothetical protein K1T71_014700 [Dendrolimus kikuchii]